MATAVEAYDIPEHREAATASVDAPVSVPDPLTQVRTLKRWTQIGVYGAITGTVPLYLFVLGFTLWQETASYITGLIIATAAIEGAFAQMYRLRKRSAYPGLLVMELGGMQKVSSAVERSLRVIQHVMRVRASFLALRVDDENVNLISVLGMSRINSERFVQVGAPNLREALESGQPAAFRPASALLLEAMVGPKERMMFVPVLALQKPIGVLGLLGHEGNSDIKDVQLLRTMGIALGLSLENLRQKEELREMAAVDELTLVYNRRYFFEQMEREMAAAERYATPLALLIVDMDGLKHVNDTFGHAAGDAALRALAQRLVRFSRAADIVARVGGDEFAVILPRTSKEAAGEIAGRIREAVAREGVAAAEGVSLPVSVCAGHAAFPDDAEDMESLLRQADASMYCAKAALQSVVRS